MAHVEDRWKRPGRHTGKRWRARYINPDGRERNRSFATKAAAERFLTEVEHSKNHGDYRDPDAGRETLRRYAAGWVRRHHEDSVRGERIRGQLALHILPALGDETLAMLERQPGRVQRFLDQLPMGNAGKSQVAITLGAIFLAAADEGLIGRSPMRVRSAKIPRQPESHVEPWSPAQVAAVRAAMPGRWRAAVDCGAGLGLRQGEIFGLAGGDVDFLRRQVRVRRQVIRVGARSWFKLPKGDKERTVPLPESVALALAAHIAAHPAAAVTLPWNEPGKPKLHGRPVTAALLFRSRTGGALVASTFNTSAWRPARAAAAADDGMHVLRHTYASVLLAGGVDIKALSGYLGHRSAVITLSIYAHLMPQAEDRALKAVEAAFAAARETPDGHTTALAGENQL